MSSRHALMVHQVHDLVDTGRSLLDVGGLGFTGTFAYLNSFPTSERSESADQLLQVYISGLLELFPHLRKVRVSRPAATSVYFGYS